MADGRRSQPEVGEEDPTQLGSRGALRRSVSGRMGLPDAPPVLAPDPALAIGTDAPFEPAPGGAPTAISPSPPPAVEGPAPPNVPIGNAETVQIRARREAGSASVPGTIGRTANSPVEAMFLEEVARTRVFALMCIAIDIFALVGLPFLGGNTLVRNILIGQLVVNLLGATYLYFDLRDPGRYRGTVVMSLALLATITAYTAILYWGINSAAPCMIVLGIYFFSRNQSLAAALVVYGLCAGTQAILAAVTLSGAIDDPGMYTGEGLPIYVQIITQVIIQFMFFAAYVLARSGRTSTLRVVDGLLQAHRHAEQREAAFQEVKQDLDRMLQLGGPGRHTDRILGNYKLGVVIGRGAMGEVYEALHMQGGDRAAVKLLHPNVLSHPGSIERFLREAKAAGALESQHVVRVLDASPPGSGLPYLIMEYLTGNDLAHHLRKRRRLPFDKFEQLARQVASALDEAAEKGIVHRDIKPQNLFLLERPSGPPIWKVLDFGASKLAQHKGTLTEGRVVGTPAYMAPEQARGEDVSPSADIYALAAISYRCLTGRPPFSGKDLPTTLYNVCYSMPPQPSLIAEVPHAIDSVLAVGLAKTAAERFESAGELADALAAALGGHRDDWIERRAQALLAHMMWGATP